MDDISRYIELMNKIQDGINTSAIQAIQKQGATIQNVLDSSSGLQKLDYQAVYGSLIRMARFPVQQFGVKMV